MPQRLWATIPESSFNTCGETRFPRKDLVLGIRKHVGCCSDSTTNVRCLSFFCFFWTLWSLCISGCATTSFYENKLNDEERPGNSLVYARTFESSPPSMNPADMVVRLQGPAPLDGQGYETHALPVLPPLPAPSLPVASFSEGGSSDTSGAMVPHANAEIGSSPGMGVTADGDSPSIRGLSSIARNRIANRKFVQPAPSTSGMLSDAAAGRFTSRSTDRGLGNLSPRLRDRIENSVTNGEDPQFKYPDIHVDPAKLYHDRFGLEEDHDPFLLPWLSNLIFEDRWLLAELDPEKAVQNQLRRRLKINIRDPDPDTANFPNGAYTLPKGRLYIENSPVGLYGASKTSPRIYQWEYLIRYGLTDNLEFRIFSNGFTSQAQFGKQAAVVGYSPLAFDFKANFWEENTRYHIPAMGMEMYLQTTFGSPSFNNGTQPSLNILFDQSLPFGIGFEYNIGIAGVQNTQGNNDYEFSFQWSFQREVVKDFDFFVHGFYNAASLPRLLHIQSSSESDHIQSINVVGAGAIWTVNDRLAVFGSYNLGTTTGAPKSIALSGFAVAF